MPLLNLSKIDSSRVSKILLDRINSKARDLLKCNQWPNTDNVIHWFKLRDTSRKLKFIQFNICKFYPSITENLLHKTLDYLGNIVDIPVRDREIINAARMTLLYSGGRTWVKKDGIWDVSMGSWDGAEVCEAVGLYLLHRIQSLNISIGLYRDDGLCISDRTKRQNENMKKLILKNFK